MKKPAFMHHRHQKLCPLWFLLENDDSPKFASMEEMAVNVLKGMTVKKEKSKSNEGENAETPFVTSEKGVSFRLQSTRNT
jgi:hypothetical protein